MAQFKLTTDTKHYVNAEGNRCEAALLNGVWVAVWMHSSNHLGDYSITTHSEDGMTITHDSDSCVYNAEDRTRLRNLRNITAAFEGWDSNPFEGMPPEYRFATFEGFYEEEPRAFEEAECFGGGFLGFSQDGIIKHELSDQFISPFKDPWGYWAENSRVSRADFEGEK